MRKADVRAAIDEIVQQYGIAGECRMSSRPAKLTVRYAGREWQISARANQTRRQLERELGKLEMLARLIFASGPSPARQLPADQIDIEQAGAMQ